MGQIISYYRTQESLDSVRREASYITLIEFVIPMKLLGLRKICLIKVYSIDRISKHLSGTFPAQIVLKKVVLYFATLL